MTVAVSGAGSLRGLAGDGVTVFRGVPYATARRFAPPERAAAWAGVREATAHGPIAPQPRSRLAAAMGDFSRPQDEDCLTLTIATPGVDAGRRPVIVWLHGGAYLSGAGSLDWYDGSVLARDGDAVVVGVNYRLGALGFLHLPGVAEGNMGLLDMVAALEWVRDHIAAFGGDPARVTLMGQSAGAHAIMCLLTMPATAGLFRRAILQSAPPSMSPLTGERAAEYGGFLAGLLGTDAAGLADVAVGRLVAAQMEVARGIARFGDITPPFVPVGDALAEPRRFVAAAAHAAGERGVDLVIGTTREEMGAFFAADPAMAEPDPAAVAARFAALAGDPAAIELYRRRRPGGSVAELLGDLVTDHMFLFPSLLLADAATAAGRSAWVYQFDWAPPGNRFRACHCLELPFVFGNPGAWADAAMLEGHDPAVVAALSAAIRSAWTGFAGSGDPGTALQPWPAYRPGSRQTMRFDSIVGSVGDLAGAALRAGLDGEGNTP
jgi:para-nitrobenzyl esterase